MRPCTGRDHSYCLPRGLDVLKKEIAGRLGAYLGATRILEAAPGRPFLLVVNYHRIGDAHATPYDAGTFSCTTSTFVRQIQYLKRRFRIVDLHQATLIVHGQLKITRPTVLITFDDGYLDNYEEAFPVLQHFQVPAAFFLPTSFIGTGTLPWWDQIASIVKTSRFDRVTLSYPETVEFNLSPPHKERSIQSILRLLKRPSTLDSERFVQELEDACGSSRPRPEAARCFLNWDEAREMQQHGMSFGSHTHTHEILSKLPYHAQFQELCISRECMESELDRSIDTLAYPVGQDGTFDDDTFQALREAKYQTAFSFHSGVNRPGHIQPFNVLRGGVYSESHHVFRLRVTARAALGRELF